MRISAFPGFSFACALALIVSCDSSSSESGDLCSQAADMIASCGGTPPAAPPEGCVDSLQEASQEILDAGCDGLQDDGKADSFLCSPALVWAGLCKPVPLATVAQVPSLDDVCTTGADHTLCTTLKAGDFDGARSRIISMVEAGPRAQVLTDPALKWWMRERVAALLAWNVAQTRQESVSSALVNDVLGTLFPAYDPESFALAHAALAPSTDTCADQPAAAVAFFPGVVRLTDRREFTQQAEAVKAALPCVRTYVVDTGSFVSPSVNATRGADTMATIESELGDVPVHFVGYSQGSMNALTTLVEHSDIAPRVASVMVMNSAAHGSEVADTMATLMSGLDGNLCVKLPAFASPACEWADDQSPRPNEFLMEQIARAMGIPVDDLAAFIAAEDDVAPAPDLKSFFAAHTPGVKSLGTTQSAQFWATKASGLPTDSMYFSFRAVISDPKSNLPFSNRLFFTLLERAGNREPYNDMQVRLVNQRLGGPVANVEVVGRVAEGNHWQWELATGAVPETVMPADMTDRIPHREYMVAYFQALAEVGLLTSNK